MVQRQPDGNEFVLFVTPTLQNEYAEGATFSRLVAPLIAFADGREVDLDRPFQPFGGEAGVGRTFQLGWLPDEVPEVFEIEVEAEVARPTAVLRWEYLAGDSWRPVEPDQGRHPKPDRNRRDRVRRPSRHRAGRGQWPGGLLAARPAGGRRLRPAGWPSSRSTSGTRAAASACARTPATSARPSSRASASATGRSGHRPSSPRTRCSSGRSDAGGDIVPFVPASALPAPYDDAEPALYLGFDRPFPEQPVTLHVALAPLQVAGRVARENRLVAANGAAGERVTWDYFDGRAWAPLAVLDGTDDLTVSGSIKFLAPADMAPLARFDLTERVLDPRPDRLQQRLRPHAAAGRLPEHRAGPTVRGRGRRSAGLGHRDREPDLPPRTRAGAGRPGDRGARARAAPRGRPGRDRARGGAGRGSAAPRSGDRRAGGVGPLASGAGVHRLRPQEPALSAGPCLRPRDLRRRRARHAVAGSARTTSSRATGPAAGRAATWGRARSRRSSRRFRAWRPSPTPSAPTAVRRPRARRRRSHAARRTLGHRGLAVTAPEIEQLAMEVAGTLSRARPGARQPRPGAALPPGLGDAPDRPEGRRRAAASRARSWSAGSGRASPRVPSPASAGG